MVNVSQVVTDHKTTVAVMVSLYHVLLSKAICIVSPLTTVQVSPMLFQLIRR